MSNFKKLMMTAAGGDVLNVEDVFSTYVYDGNSSNRSITNGIDLSTEGGLVWIKGRTSTTYDFNNTLFDTERGAGYRIHTDLTSAQGYNNNSLTSFNTDGFSLGTDGSVLVNWSSNDYVSWTFRKAPKFFDVVTYAGTGSNQTISHNLGSTPGMIIVKAYSGTGGWVVYHRSNGATKYMYLNGTGAVDTSSLAWNDTAPTSTEFTIGTLGGVNVSGRNYVAYLFAHNDGDGNFGPTGDQDIIKCGSYTGSNSQELNIGFEPQWILIKRTDVAEDWILFDNMRGMSDTNNGHLEPNRSNAEQTSTLGSVLPTPQGIQFDASTMGEINSGGDDFIYIAIRRGPMAVPESATDVFEIDTRTAVSSVSGTDPSFSASFPADMALWRTVDTAANNLIASRLTQSKLLYTNLTNAQGSSTNGLYYFDKENGWYSSTSSDPDSYSWMWRRAPNFFDVVAYTGNSTAGRTVKHNLGVAPEMIWVKKRNSSSNSNWFVFHSGIGNGKFLLLNTTSDATTSTIAWNDTDPTETTFTLGVQQNVNYSNDKYIAYLFATLAGISKVGGYTGNGSSQTIDCGFTSGARFILIKRTDAGSTGDWHFWDTERGIVAGNDPFLELNTTSTQNSSYDSIDPDSSGFIVNQDAGTNINVSSATYIFYAIA